MKEDSPAGISDYAALKEIVITTGLSGSGKSIALHALEDAGFFCVDNLPPELLTDLLKLDGAQLQPQARLKGRRLAISIDVRSAQSLHLLPKKIMELQQLGVPLKVLYLDCREDILVRRFSETRRRHPLSQSFSDSSFPDESPALLEAIQLEKELLADLHEQAYVLDTSMTLPAMLQTQIKAFVNANVDPMLLMFESFSYKRGIPLGADFVFDVRMLPNPYYDLNLRSLTGKDAAVQHFFKQTGEAQELIKQVNQFLQTWLDPLNRSHRSYVTVAVGCTGGQHRSVYVAEQLYTACQHLWPTRLRHRELPSSDTGIKP